MMEWVRQKRIKNISDCDSTVRFPCLCCILHSHQHPVGFTVSFLRKNLSDMLIKIYTIHNNAFVVNLRSDGETCKQAMIISRISVGNVCVLCVYTDI